MTTILLIVLPLVAVLCMLIAVMNHGEHYAPQAYYRHKRGGAPVAHGFESLGPRPRKRVALELVPQGGDARSVRETEDALASDAALRRLLEVGGAAELRAPASR